MVTPSEDHRPLGAREATDVALLTSVIDANLDEAGFIVRKAMDWALREHGETDAKSVRQFVSSLQERWSTLCLREALKRLG